MYDFVMARHFHWFGITCQSVLRTQAMDVLLCTGHFHWLRLTCLSVIRTQAQTCHGWHFYWLSITCQSVLRTQALMYDFVAAGTFAGSESPVCSQNPSPGCMTLLWLALLLAQNHLSVLRTQALDV